MNKKEKLRSMEFEIPSDTKIGEGCRTIIDGLEITDFVTNIKVEILCADNIDSKGRDLFQDSDGGKMLDKKIWDEMIALLKKHKIKTTIKKS